MTAENTAVLIDHPAAGEVLTLEEACQLLKVSRVTMHRLLKADKALRSHGRKVGNRWRFTRRGLLDWIESGQA